MSLCLDRETIWRNKGWGEKRVWRNVQGSSSPGHLHRTVPKIPPCVWEQCPNTHWALTALGPWSLSWARRQTLVYSKFYFGAKHMKRQQGNQWGSAALETWWWQNPVINNCQGKKNDWWTQSLPIICMTVLSWRSYTALTGPVHIDRNKVCTLQNLFSLVPEWEMAAETSFPAHHRQLCDLFAVYCCEWGPSIESETLGAQVSLCIILLTWFFLLDSNKVEQIKLTVL